MRFYDYRPAQPVKGQIKPWHPETLEDIRNLDIYTLPTDHNGFNKVQANGTWMFLGSIGGHPGFIKERMEASFLQYPSVGFMMTPNGIVHAYVFETTDKETMKEDSAISTLLKLARRYSSNPAGGELLYEH